MWELILALLIGILAGTFTGMIPGIHTNLIAVLLTSVASVTLIPPLPAIVFISSMAITHTFVSFIPSVFLGAPEEDTFLSILPGHQMLKEGSAHEAVILTLYGSMAAIAIILIFTPAFILAIPAISRSIGNILPFILIFVSCFLILREKDFFLAFIVFSLSGILGFISLNLPVNQPLLPLLAGLFGASSLAISIKNKVKIPKQSIPKLREIKITRKDFYKASLASMISAPLCSFLPGVGAGHAAIIGSELIKQSMKGFIFLLGSINTIVVGLSFITLYTIGRTRTGAAVAVKEILDAITLTEIFFIIASMILSGLAAFIIALQVSKLTAKNISKINYTKISVSVLILLSALSLAISGILGLFIFITSTFLGIYTILSGSRRTNLMGSLLLPTILFYLF